MTLQDVITRRIRLEWTWASSIEFDFNSHMLVSSDGQSRGVGIIVNLDPGVQVDSVPIPLVFDLAEMIGSQPERCKTQIGGDLIVFYFPTG